MKKYMTIEELFDFISSRIELDLSELTEFIIEKDIQPKTKISNIPRYEQEDCQAIYDYFAANNSKKSTEKKETKIEKSKSDTQEKNLEKRDYTIPEIATLLNENKTKFYRFVGQHKIEPAAVKNKTKYFSYEDTLRIIDHFSDLETFNVTTEPQSELPSELDATTEELNNNKQEEPEEDLNAVTGEPESVTTSELQESVSELQDEQTIVPVYENAVKTGEPASERDETEREPTVIYQEDQQIETKDSDSVTTFETIEKNNSFTHETMTGNQENILDIEHTNESEIVNETIAVRRQPAAVTEEISQDEPQPFKDQTYQNQLTEITYLKSENELLRSELDQKNRQLAELTQRLEQAQYLHSKTQNISEKQQPFFKMPEIIEADKIETTEENEPQKRSFLGFLKKNN